MDIVMAVLEKNRDVRKRDSPLPSRTRLSLVMAAVGLLYIQKNRGDGTDRDRSTCHNAQVVFLGVMKCVSAALRYGESGATGDGLRYQDWRNHEWRDVGVMGSCLAKWTDGRWCGVYSLPNDCR